MRGFDEAAYAPFVAAHEDRLVCSLVAESGLPRATAASLVAEVLPAAFGRGFASDGAAYGWLRVAARHHAAGNPTWADAADAALVQADVAAVALASLPPLDREVVRLRYAEGLLPAAVAERLGTDTAHVTACLERVRDAAARALPLTPRRAVTVPLPRAAAALALVAAAAFVGFGGGAPSLLPPAAAAPVPAHVGAGEPPVTVFEPVPAAERRAVRGVRAERTGAVAVPRGRGTTPPAGGDTATPPDAPTCLIGCQPPSAFSDELHVLVPPGAAEILGDDEVVVTVKVGDQDVEVCDTVAGLPEDVARCVSGGE